MDDSAYKVVFDISHFGYKAWWFPSMGLIFIFFGIIGIPLLNHLSSSSRRWSPDTLFVFQMVFVGFAIVWTLFSLIVTLGDYLGARAALLDHNFGYVEGPVENFVPMPISGHADESFTVKGVPFSYSDFEITAGFNNTSSHGGPIRAGLPVRIWYENNRKNEILKLAIKNP